MRAARPRLAVLLLHACSCVLVEGFAVRAAKDPRRGVIQQLFGSTWSGPNILKPLRPSMTKRKETLLRGKIAAKRSFVDQINREIAALDARSCVVTGPERTAHETRVAILRRETDVLERQLGTLRNYLGKVTGYDGDLTRPGLYGMIARGYEKFIATEERSNPNPSPSPSPNPNANPNPNPNPNPNSNPKQERSARVMFEQMRRKGDAWALVREDAASILRLGTNLSVSTGYMTLGGSAALLPHTAAIFARANKLESIAPGLLAVISEHEALPLVEPHLD